MRGQERREAGAAPAELMEEGFRARWAILHPSEDIPPETAILFAAWAIKQRARRAAVSTQDAEPPTDDDDPFAETFTPRQAGAQEAGL